MRGALYLALAMIAGAVLANVLLADPGYVGVRFAGYLIEMSVPTLVLSGVAIYFLLRLLLRAVRARSLVQVARRERKEERARRSLARGIVELSRGDWSQAERTLLETVHDVPSPTAHYITAARAAELQGNERRRDDLLARALEAAPEDRAAILIMQAELHMKHKQFNAARAMLEQLEATGEQNSRGLVLLARVYDQLGEWEKLKQLEPRLRSVSGVAPGTIERMLTQSYLDQLKAAGQRKDAKEVQHLWEHLPSNLNGRPEIVVGYARAAMSCGRHDLAAKELQASLEREWDEAAITAFGEVNPDDSLQTLEVAESWLEKHPEDPSLLVTCARLCIRAELYGKARSYLETSIAIRPRLDTYQLLATLLEQLGDRERAHHALHAALVHALGRRAELPKIHARRWTERRQGDRRRN